jgi:hypothetical protein
MGTAYIIKTILIVTYFLIGAYFLFTGVTQGNRLIRKYNVKLSEFFISNPPIREPQFYTERRRLFLRIMLGYLIPILGNSITIFLWGFFS